VRRCDAAGAGDIAESSTLLLWLWCGNLGELAELHRRLDPPRERISAASASPVASGARESRARGSAHYMSPAQISQHTI